MSVQDKSVCIVIPVYKAERYLGYCLNSLLSQTYTNWRAILVDDGSPDGSLDICKDYQQIDSRFEVYSKPNGGVSSARNYGLRFAEGDYLVFLDSDDCLAPDALEKQVTLAQRYNSQLVVMDSLIVDFSNPTENRVPLSSAWLEESPCFLDREAFREKRMRLIWFTALLESPWAKLFDLNLWKRLDLQFPEELSLGEDFVTNMKYYEACNGAVFLHEVGHYYNCPASSTSLAGRYREDLFEIKMYLIEALEKHLGGVSGLSDQECDAFYCYAASSGLKCIERLVKESGLKDAAICDRLRNMLENELFFQSVQKAGWIPDLFQACLPFITGKDYSKIIQSIRGNQAPKIAAASKQGDVKAAFAVENIPSVRSPGRLNKLVRKMLHATKHILRLGRWPERLSRWIFEIEELGLKNTFKKHVADHKKPDIAFVSGQVQELRQQLVQQKESARNTERLLLEQLDIYVGSLKEQADALTKGLETLNNEHRILASVLEERATFQNNLIASQGDRVFNEINARVFGVYNRMEEQFGRLQNNLSDVHQEINSVSGNMSREFEGWNEETTRQLEQTAAALRESITGHTWLVEQRLNQYSYQRDINALRQKKKMLILATAEHANIGDAAITMAEQQFLLTWFPEYYQIEVSTYEFERKEEYLHAILGPEDIIFLHGGGNIGDMYLVEETLHRRIVETFPNHPIVILPQTISFSDTRAGQEELRKSAEVYNRHGNLTLYVRGQVSLDFAQRHFHGVTVRLMPDMAHQLKTDYAFQREGALLCLRDDFEGILGQDETQSIVEQVRARFDRVDWSNNMHTEDISRSNRAYVVRNELMRFAKQKVVITDRLHGMIFAAITGTPCVVMPTCNHKIREYYQSFFRDSNAIFFVENAESNLTKILEQALAVTTPRYRILEENPHAEICREIRAGSASRERLPG